MNGVPQRALALLEIANFASLRRHIGKPRAARLTYDIARQIMFFNPVLQAQPVGLTMVEIGFSCVDAEDCRHMLHRVIEHFAQPVTVDSERYLVSVCIGATVTPGGDDDDIRLAEAAEAAVAEARTMGQLIVLDLGRDEFAYDRPGLVQELPRAIADGELFLQYQPKVHLRRQEIVSAEALIRWQHPVRGVVLPGEFIAAAEAVGAIAPLTLWTLKQTISDQRLLADKGFDLPIFINISAMLLADTHFVQEAIGILKDSNAKIGFEITETAVIRDPEIALRHLQQFADMGVPIAIDDYGAGLSSLAYMKQLPASELKIDKGFVTQLTSSNRDPLIVRSTIDLAHAMEMEVVAEGVETPAAMALLSVMGCDMVQGYLISRPLGMEAFLHFLENDGHRNIAQPSIPDFRRAGTGLKSA
ncbi:hypothetical protein GCM10023219_29720 [Stakelama sediminis]